MKKLQFKLFVLVITLAVCSPISLGHQSSQNVNAPEGWKRVNAKGLFTIYLPPSAWDTGLMRIDEFYQEWRIRRMRFKVVHEPMGWLSYDRREQVFGPGLQRVSG